MKMKTLTVFTDGGCRKNPGPAAIGVYFPYSYTGLGKFIGNSRTNNEAEAEALIEALDHARANDIDQVEAFSDSQLLVHLVTGKWRASSQNMQTMLEKIEPRLSFFKDWSISWVPREQNRQADWLCNQVLDEAEKGKFFKCPQIYSTIPSFA